jgi:hypothetical protein
VAEIELIVKPDSVTDDFRSEPVMFICNHAPIQSLSAILLGNIGGPATLPRQRHLTHHSAPRHPVLVKRRLSGSAQRRLEAGKKLAHRHNQAIKMAAHHPERVQKMLAALATHWSQQPPPEWPAQIEVPQRIDEHSAQPWSADAEYVYVTI